jgi:hypothetical protein
MPEENAQNQYNIDTIYNAPQSQANTEAEAEANRNCKYYTTEREESKTP